MKRMAIFFGIIILLYSVYYDLNNGTLKLLYKEATVANSAPRVNVNQTEPSTPVDGDREPSSLPYVEMEVKPGDTVLSLVEDLLDASIPVSIDKVITDFEELNDVPPAKIQIGKTYKIPNYQ
ncbi:MULTISPECIES: hypothetical protein [Bacillaceae]|uniref:hypothetical protein n=1 Tax=Bacillaceae TaxID=186817 RepID=UPI001C566FDF|nr:hypothetical protein [Rossellomorea sp. YZS02]MBW3114316.1 hypothetical protein [Bacillus sp. MCCB 382]MDX8341850.1 hypothetical protein [Rossellomorea sp. YZS02]